MKIKQLFISCLLLTGSAMAYADCGENDFFPDTTLKQETKIYEGKQVLLEDYHYADTPAEWNAD